MKTSSPQLPLGSISESEVDRLLQALTREEDESSSTREDSQDLGCLNHVPPEVLLYINSITRSQRLARYVLGEVDAWVCRRLPTGNATEARRRRWASAWQYKAEQIKHRMGRIRDREACHAHLSMADDAAFGVFDKLPKLFQRWQPNEEGELVIDDPRTVKPSIGSPAYMEQTPVHLVRFVHETWKRRAWNPQDDGVACLLNYRRPSVWDLTAGSGTVRDYFQRIYGCRVISRDLCPVAHEVECACASDLGTGGSHTARGIPGIQEPGPSVRCPDLILFDPPSLGTPAHRELYYGPDGVDFAELAPRAWVDAVSHIATRAARRIRKDGLVSLLVRHGRRRHGDIHPMPELLAAVKAKLADQTQIVSEHALRFRSRRNQVSLGRARIPATHLLLGRPT